MNELPTAYPLRDLFDAAVRQRNIRLFCPVCRHAVVFDAHALWWHFSRRGWGDRFNDVRKRCVCSICWIKQGRVGRPELALVDEPPTETRLPLPSEIDWQREVRRRR
ncbi:MAG: hypothetical protein ACT4OE_04770 [Sphingosinicella sp.]